MLIGAVLWACDGKEPAEEESCVAEVPYDGVDQDCDGEDLADVDGDSYLAVQAGGDDCADDDAAIFPGAQEIPYDGLDQDCADGDLLDVDGDGHASDQHGGDDCADDDASVHPDAEDGVGDGVDQSCDGLDGLDGDGDGYASLDSGGDDCDDGEPAISPGAAEIWYDQIDQNCDQQCDFDQDGDGAVLEGTEVVNGTPCDQDPSPQPHAEQDCNDEDPLVVWVEVHSVYPSNGSDDVALTTAVHSYTTTQGAAPPGVVITLTDAFGAVVPGTNDGVWTVVFTPDEPLRPLETYQVEVAHGCGLYNSSFTTAPAPDPVDTAELVGRTYELSMASGEWLEPPGVGDLIASQLGDTTLLIEVTAVGTDTVDLLLGVGSPDGQDLCSTTELLVSDFSVNPYVVVAPPELVLSVSGYEMVLESPQLTGRFQPDASALADLSLAAVVDTRPMVDAFGLAGGDSAICDLVASFGVSCAACEDGSGSYCLPILVEDFDAPQSLVDLEARSESDIAADPNCP